MAWCFIGSFGCRMLGNVFKEAQEVLHAVEENRCRWVLMNDKVKDLHVASSSSLDIFSVELDDEDS